MQTEYLTLSKQEMVAIYGGRRLPIPWGKVGSWLWTRLKEAGGEILKAEMIEAWGCFTESFE